MPKLAGSCNACSKRRAPWLGYCVLVVIGNHSMVLFVEIIRSENAGSGVSTRRSAIAPSIVLNSCMV